MNFRGLGKFLAIVLVAFGAITGIITLLGMSMGVWGGVALCLLLSAAIGFYLKSFTFATSIAASGCSAAYATTSVIAANTGAIGYLLGIPAGMLVAVVVFSVVFFTMAIFAPKQKHKTPASSDSDTNRNS